MGPWRRFSRAALAAASVVVVAGCALTPPVLEPPDGRLRWVSTIDKRALLSDDAVERIVDATGPGCSAAVGVRGEVVWTGVAGLADVAAGVPVTPATRFDMASVAKQFTATAVLMLRREGALDLAAPVATYVDGLPAWGRTVTLEQLLHHTSRLRDYWIRLEADGLAWSDPVSHAQTVDAIRRMPTREPGDGYLYSNSNYVLLAEVVHRVSGVPLPQFLTERMFTPLGLAMDPTPLLDAPDVARSYDADGVQLSPAWEAYGPMGIFTTPSELVRWGDQYRAGELVQDDFAEGAVDQGTGELYGAGIDLEPNGRLNHNGRFGGHITTFTVSADRTTTISVMCNGHSSPRLDLDAALWEIWDAAAEPDDDERVAG